MALEQVATATEECRICTEPVIYVKVLPCEHALCQLCLERISLKTSVTCPKCREKFNIDPSKGAANCFHTKYFGKVLCEICSTPKSTEDTVVCIQCVSTICSTCHLRKHAKRFEEHQILYWDAPEFTQYLTSGLETLKLDSNYFKAWKAENSITIRKEMKAFAEKIADEMEEILVQQMETNTQLANAIKQKISTEVVGSSNRFTVENQCRMSNAVVLQNTEKITRVLKKYTKLTQIDHDPEDLNYNLTFERINYSPSAIAKMILTEATLSPLNIGKEFIKSPETATTIGTAVKPNGIAAELTAPTSLTGIDLETFGISPGFKNIIATFSLNTINIWHEANDIKLIKTIKAPIGDIEQVVICDDAKLVCCFTTLSATYSDNKYRQFWYQELCSSQTPIEITAASETFKKLYFEDLILDITQTGELFACTSNRRAEKGIPVTYKIIRKIDYISNSCCIQIECYIPRNNSNAGKSLFKTTTLSKDGDECIFFAVSIMADAHIHIYEGQYFKAFLNGGSGLRNILFDNDNNVVRVYNDKVSVRENHNWKTYEFKKDLVEKIINNPINRFAYFGNKIVFMYAEENSLFIIDVLARSKAK